MDIPYKFYEDEVREGFYISGFVKQSWAAQLEVLCEVDKVCKKHNIRWFADCGTLLGAVRHGGYIPWDDDLDICMLRPDYKKFFKYAKEELPEGYVLLDCMNRDEDFFNHLLRVTNAHGCVFDENFMEKYHNPYATGIDIFPLDYIADDEEEENRRKTILKPLLIMEESLEDDDSNLDELREGLNALVRSGIIRIDFSKSVKRQIYEFVEKTYSRYSDAGGKYVALMPYWVGHDNHKYPAELFDETVMLPFEFTELPVPAAYDDVLRIEYGDYMKIHKGGGVHEYPCYEKQEFYLMELVKGYMFKYRFNMDDLKNDARADKDKPRKQALDFTEVMKQAHQAIVLMLANKKYDTALSLLESCQNGAINIGTLLEKRYGEGFAAVKPLEEYCEIIYQIGELIGKAGETGELSLGAADIASYLNEIYEAVLSGFNQIPERKEVVFMPVRADDWPALDSVWRAAKSEENTDVYVMPIPYYEREPLGGFGTMHYEGALFPEYLDIVNYEEFDVEIMHPDEIIIQNAYDRCNYTTCIEPRYFSENIKAHTEKLIYIPWFKVDEIDDDSEKEKKVMQYYCTVPGVSHADEVIVQSEQTRQAYIDCLTEFAGEETRNVWEKKIVAGGSSVDECENREKAFTDRKKIIENLDVDGKEALFDADGNVRKILLYNTTVASYMQNGAKFLDKIERSLKVLEENSSEVAVIWKAHPQLRSLISSTNPKLVHKYDRLVREFKESGVGIFDSETDLDKLVKICDAYYGDVGGAAHKCQVQGLPIMFQSMEI